LFLNSREDGACVFLQEDNLCAIHALYGPEFKPAFCREYPYVGALDPRGIAIVARPDCSGFHQTFESGTPLEQAIPAFAALSRPYGIRRFMPQHVPLLNGKAMALDDYMQLEQQMLRCIDDPTPPPEQAITAIREMLSQTLGESTPAPDMARAGVQALGLVQALAEALEASLNTPPGSDPVRRKMFQILSDTHTILQSAATQIADDPAPLNPSACAYFNLVLRTHILSKSVFSIGDLSTGLGLFLLGTRIARAAAASSPSPLAPAQLGPVFAPWARFTHNQAVQNLLSSAKVPLIELFLYSESRP